MLNRNIPSITEEIAMVRKDIYMIEHISEQSRNIILDQYQKEVNRQNEISANNMKIWTENGYDWGMFPGRDMIYLHMENYLKKYRGYNPELEKSKIK